ncbi:MAG: hypothetical protein ABRQ39_31270 [Candidatus Eremiobacterota bacterium]
MNLWEKFKNLIEKEFSINIPIIRNEKVFEFHYRTEDIQVYTLEEYEKKLKTGEIEIIGVSNVQDIVKYEEDAIEIILNDMKITREELEEIMKEKGSSI